MIKYRITETINQQKSTTVDAENKEVALELAKESFANNSYHLVENKNISIETEELSFLTKFGIMQE